MQALHNDKTLKAEKKTLQLVPQMIAVHILLLFHYSSTLYIPTL